MAAAKAKARQSARSVAGSAVANAHNVALAGLGVAGVAADAGAKLFALGARRRRAEVEKLEESVGEHENLREEVTQTSTKLFE